MTKTDQDSRFDLDAGLATLEGWTLNDETALEKHFKFKDFSCAFGFMAQVALLAEKANHHPDWSNSYNRVTITLKTHDEASVTQKDIDLAKAIDTL